MKTVSDTFKMQFDSSCMTTDVCGYPFMMQIVHNYNSTMQKHNACAHQTVFKASASKLQTFNQPPPATDFFSNSECGTLARTNPISVVSYTLTHAHSYPHLHSTTPIYCRRVTHNNLRIHCLVGCKLNFVFLSTPLVYLASTTNVVILIFSRILLHSSFPLSPTSSANNAMQAPFFLNFNS